MKKFVSGDVLEVAGNVITGGMIVSMGLTAMTIAFSFALTLNSFH
jgi:hypothetical protein